MGVLGWSQDSCVLLPALAGAWLKPCVALSPVAFLGAAGQWGALAADHYCHLVGCVLWWVPGSGVPMAGAGVVTYMCHEGTIPACTSGVPRAALGTRPPPLR